MNIHLLTDLLRQNFFIKWSIASEIIKNFVFVFERVFERANFCPVFRLVSVESPIIATCQSELSVLATKFNIIQGTIQYMEDTIKRIKESWENILLEMDTKLASYAKPNPPGMIQCTSSVLTSWISNCWMMINN